MGPPSRRPATSTAPVPRLPNRTPSAEVNGAPGSFDIRDRSRSGTSVPDRLRTGIADVHSSVNVNAARPDPAAATADTCGFSSFVSRRVTANCGDDGILSRCPPRQFSLSCPLRRRRPLASRRAHLPNQPYVIDGFISADCATPSIFALHARLHAESSRCRCRLIDNVREAIPRRTVRKLLISSNSHQASRTGPREIWSGQVVVTAIVGDPGDIGFQCCSEYCSHENLNGRKHCRLRRASTAAGSRRCWSRRSCRQTRP
jgi:hypothetical protein